MILGLCEVWVGKQGYQRAVVEWEGKGKGLGLQHLCALLRM